MAFQALIQTMTSLNDIHDTLFELAEQKKQVLIRNEVEKLTQIVSKENKLIKQIGELDNQRVEVTAQFMIAKGFKPNAKVTISDLSKIIFDVEEKKTLVGLQRKLLVTIRGLREINQLNQQLIEQSLAFIDYSMDVIVGPPEDEVVYQHPKLSGNGAKRSSLFDGKV